MIHLLGAIVLCVISVRAFTKGKKIYVEEKGWYHMLIAVVFAITGVLCIVFAEESVQEFIKYWRAS